jgi:Zn-dependent metalloprotease
MKTLSCPCDRNSLHCLIPPYMLEKLTASPNAKVRAWAIKNLSLGASMRSRRAAFQLAPSMGVSASVSGKKSRTVYNAKGGFQLPGMLARNEGDAKSSDAAVNEAYDHSGTVYDFYWKILGRNSLDDEGMRIISSVHVGEGPGVPMNNAFWDGSQLAYGDGDGVIFNRFTKALDVVGHELAHGVTSFTSNLIYQGQSGALNEHFSDVFGILVRQWKKKQTAAKASWLVGDDIVVKSPTIRALRDMENPGTAFKNDPNLGDDPQPAHMQNLYKGQGDYGGVHINSGIPNRAFVLASKAVGGNAWQVTGKIWYETLKQLSASAKFADCARISRQIASDSGASAKTAVDNAWKAVGL